MKNLTKGLIGLLITFVTVISLPVTLEYKINEEFYQNELLKEHLEREIKCLAKNIFYEAGGESYNGKLAVAQVTVNRLNHKKFPDTICEVVKQKSIFRGKVVCQFSWFCTSKSSAVIPKDSKRYQESLRAAKQVLIEDLGLNYLKDALYFHAVYINPNWNKVQVAKIGNHIFYSDSKR